MALAKLHNFCIDEDDIPVRQRFHEDVMEGDQFEVLINESFFDEEEQCFLTTHRTGNRRRNNFSVVLEEKGLRRPNYNINSTA